MTTQPNPLHPSPSLLCKLGSIAGHVEEGKSKDGHPYDFIAIDTLLSDPEVQEWMAAMRKMAMIPEPRNNPKGKRT